MMNSLPISHEFPRLSPLPHTLTKVSVIFLLGTSLLFFSSTSVDLKMGTLDTQGLPGQIFDGP